MDAGGIGKAPKKQSVKADNPANKTQTSAGSSRTGSRSAGKAVTGATPTAPTGTTGSNNTGNVLLKWHDVEFYANAQEVRGLTEFSISGSVETEDKKQDGTNYVSKKNSKGYEATLTAFFDKRLGIADVKAEAMKLVDYGANGQTGYLYAQGQKLVTCSLMMTSAKADNIIMIPNGTWISAEVQLTLKTCSKLDGTTTPATGKGGGGKKWKITVYYSGSSGAVSSVSAESTVSEADARKKAWAKVPKNAQWASETKTQATNQVSSKIATATQQLKTAKDGIVVRNEQVQQKKTEQKQKTKMDRIR